MLKCRQAGVQMSEVWETLHLGNTPHLYHQLFPLHKTCLSQVLAGPQYIRFSFHPPYTCAVGATISPPSRSESYLKELSSSPPGIPPADMMWLTGCCKLPSHQEVTWHWARASPKPHQEQVLATSKTKFIDSSYVPVAKSPRETSKRWKRKPFTVVWPIRDGKTVFKQHLT